jgi:Ca-activated chloride channel family protein
MRFLMTALAFFSILPVSAAFSADKTIIVLDASGSMWGQIDGKSKMEIARDTLDTVLKSVPPGNELGLIVYGHREKGSCDDIELAVPPKANSAGEISAFARQVNPKGKTPISKAVREAAEALKYTEEKATVVLVTDGLETCEADPCAVASELEKNGVDFTAHVVGFGLTAEEGKKVACLAENTGGKYFQASDAGQLAQALVATVAAEPPKVQEAVEETPAEPVAAEPEFNMITDAVMLEGGPSLGDSDDVRWDIYKTDAAGNRTDEGVAGNYDATLSATLAPGRYVGLARLGAVSREVAFEVKAGEIAHPFVNFDAGSIKITPKRTAADAAADDNARVDLASGQFSDGNYGEKKFFVPAGEITITGKIGPTSVEEKLTIKAGENLEHTLLIAAGVVVANAVYAPGGPAVEGGDIRFDVLASKPEMDGSRPEIVTNYGTGLKLDVPAGAYILRARLGSATGEMPFTSKAGERVEVSVNINAGVLAIKAPGAQRIDILSAKKDIQGDRARISTGYETDHHDTLPPGDYIVQAQYADDKAPKEMPVTVKAGERSEITVE